jgi:hypothetical protein
MSIVLLKVLLLRAASLLEWGYPAMRGSCSGIIGLMYTRSGYVLARIYNFASRLYP